MSSNELTVDAFAALSVSGLINIPDIATAGLYFVFSETGVWGSAEVNTNLEQLERAGVYIDATGYLQLNTTDEIKTVYPRKSAALSDRLEQELAKQSFEIYAAGTMSLFLILGSLAKKGSKSVSAPFSAYGCT